MSLITVAELRARWPTALSDETLQDVIDAVDAEIVSMFGAHYVNVATTVTETLGGGLVDLFFCRPLTSITSVVDDGVTLTSDDYRLWGSQGRLQRLPAGALWGDVVVVVYVPADDNDRRRGVMLGLARLDAERTGLKSESIGGEYSYTVADGGWDVERAAILRRLKMGLGGF